MFWVSSFSCCVPWCTTWSSEDTVHTSAVLKSFPLLKITPKPSRKPQKHQHRMTYSALFTKNPTKTKRIKFVKSECLNNYTCIYTFFVVIQILLLNDSYMKDSLCFYNIYRKCSGILLYNLFWRSLLWIYMLGKHHI